MDPGDKLEVLGGFEAQDYDAEARQRWGHTDAYAESARRTASYTKADWARIKAEGGEITAALGDLYVNDPRFTASIEKARAGLAAYQRAAMRAYAGA